MDQMYDVLVLCGLFAAFIYWLGFFRTMVIDLCFGADSSASDVDAGAAAIFAEGPEAGSAEGGGSELGAGDLGSGDMADPDFSGLAGGDFGGDFGGFGGGGL